MKVKGKKIILTGAGSGIGKELAMQLTKKGASVIALDVNSESLDKLKSELNTISTYTVDMSNNKSIDEFKDDYYKTNDSVDMIINNAGIIQPFVNVEKLEDNTINKVMNVNFFGPLRLTKIFINDLLKRKEAYIVNVSSMGGFFPFPGQTIYGASKAALKLFTEGLYAELLDTSVKVMVVFPGAVNTNITKNSGIEMDSSSSYKTLSPAKAAETIIKGIEKNKFQLYVGSDSKIMHFLYNLNPKFAIKTIKKQMDKLKKS
jgi:short-subunit dehydrogenase